MSFTYNDPSDSDLEAVRLLVGDTVEADHLLEDEEIEFFLSQEPSVHYAASASCEAIASKVAREVSFSAEGASIQLSQQYQHYREMSRSLRMEAQRHGEVQVSVSSLYDKNLTEKEPTFSIGMHDYNTSTDNASLTK